VISLSVAIMAHPKRKAQVRHVLECLGEHVPVVWDRKNDRWDTGKRSMLAYNPDCTHHLVIQDDVLVCRDLLAGVREALLYVPEDVPVSLYMGTFRPQRVHIAAAAEQATQMRASWVTLESLYWGPGVVVPTPLIRPTIDYSDMLTKIPNYDRRMSAYWEGIGRRTWYTWPSLLDHADGPSLVKGRMETNRAAHRVARTAHSFLGEGVCALSVDWSGAVLDWPGTGALPPASYARFRQKRTGRIVACEPGTKRHGMLQNLNNWERL